MPRVNPIVGIGAAAVVGIAGVMYGKSYIAGAKEGFLAEEAKLPESAITTYLNHLKDGDYEGVYQDSLIVDPHLNSEADYTAKLQEVYGDIDPSQVEFAGLDDTDGSKEYKLYYEGKFLATLKLIKSTDGSWLASTIFSGDKDYTIEVPAGLSITANGIDVDKSYLTSTKVPASNFAGLADQENAPVVDVYQLKGLLGEPEIKVKGDDSYGTLRDVVTSAIYVGKKTDDAELAQTMIDDAEICASFPAQEATAGQVLAISVPGSDWYDRIGGMQNQWFTTPTSSKFSNQSATNIIQQSDDTMVGYVTFDYYATNGDVERTWYGGYQMTFLNVNGTWKIAGMGIDNELNPEHADYFEKLNAE